MTGMSTERLEYLRKANKTSILSYKIVGELFAEIDALRAKLKPEDEPVTCVFSDGGRMSDARLATLKERYGSSPPFDQSTTKVDALAECITEIDALRTELSAVSAVGDEEVADYAIRVHTIANHALDPGPARRDLHHAADLLSRLSASLRAAEERAEKAEAMAMDEAMASGRSVSKMNVEALRNRLVAAESALALAVGERDRAREAALEEAALHIEKVGDTPMVSALRPALRETARVIRALAAADGKE